MSTLFALSLTLAGIARAAAGIPWKRPGGANGCERNMLLGRYEMHLIDADALYKEGYMLAQMRWDYEPGGLPHAWTELTPLSEAPAIDAVPVVRCGDCKYLDDDIGEDEDGYPLLKCLHGRSYGGTRINDFCSWGQRRGDGDDNVATS